MKTLIIENNWLDDSLFPSLKLPRGWGNGYVVVPKNHFAHGMRMFTIEDLFPDLSVHGGITYAGSALNFLSKAPDLNIEDWVFGFDTCHYGDSIESWPQEAVQKETDYLLVQLAILHNVFFHERYARSPRKFKKALKNLKTRTWGTSKRLTQLQNRMTLTGCKALRQF